MMQSSATNENDDGSDGADVPSSSIVVEVKPGDGPTSHSRLTPELNTPVSTSKDEIEVADVPGVPVHVPSSNVDVETARRDQSPATSTMSLAPKVDKGSASKVDDRGEGVCKAHDEKTGAGVSESGPASSSVIVGGKVDRSPKTMTLLAPKPNKGQDKAASRTGAAGISATAITSCTVPLRRGKWTQEEEAYVARIIQEFNSGYLNAPAGTTLRTYLSKKLHCDPMRITKKFQGELAIGKRVFHPAVRCETNSSAIDSAQADLESLERRWRKRLEMQQQQSAKRASAAASRSAASSSLRRTQSLDSSTKAQSSSNPDHSNLLKEHQHTPVTKASSFTHENESNLTLKTCMQATSWLDRAQALLDRKPPPSVVNSTMKSSKQQISQNEKRQEASTSGDNNAIASSSCRKVSTESASQENTSDVAMEQATTEKRPRRSQSVNSLSSMSSNEEKDVEDRISRVEGRFRSYSTGQDPSSTQRRETLSRSAPSKKTSKRHQDKKLRASQSMNSLPSYSSPEAKDAEALVGFLNTVRAAAAAGGSDT